MANVRFGRVLPDDARIIWQSKFVFALPQIRLHRLMKSANKYYVVLHQCYVIKYRLKNPIVPTFHFLALQHWRPLDGEIRKGAVPSSLLLQVKELHKIMKMMASYNFWSSANAHNKWKDLMKAKHALGQRSRACSTWGQNQKLEINL